MRICEANTRTSRCPLHRARENSGRPIQQSFPHRLRESEEIDRSRTADSIPKTISSACVVTWFNPQALIDGTMMLGAFYVTLPAAQSTSFISGVALASCLWFTGLTLLISLFSDNFTPKTLVVINKVCGVIIVFYGCKLLYSFLTIVF